MEKLTLYRFAERFKADEGIRGDLVRFMLRDSKVYGLSVRGVTLPEFVDCLKYEKGLPRPAVAEFRRLYRDWQKQREV